MKSEYREICGAVNKTSCFPSAKPSADWTDWWTRLRRLAQARRHYGLFDQVDALVRASETDPEPGFMARWLMLCTLPRSNPGSREKYVRLLSDN